MCLRPSQRSQQRSLPQSNKFLCRESDLFQERLSADVELLLTTRTKTWTRPPIEVEFQGPMLTSNEVHVRFLRVNDKSGIRWVR